MLAATQESKMEILVESVVLHERAFASYLTLPVIPKRREADAFPMLVQGRGQSLNPPESKEGEDSCSGSASCSISRMS